MTLSWQRRGSLPLPGRLHRRWRTAACVAVVSLASQLTLPVAEVQMAPVGVSSRVAMRLPLFDVASKAEQLPRLDAAVIVPGFMSGADDFKDLARKLTARGIKTVVVPMPAWHWLPCLGGRGVRPMLERIDHSVRHLAAGGGDLASVPDFSYSPQDLWEDLWENPGEAADGSGAEPYEPPATEPHGDFPSAGPPRGRVAIIGHSAGGWIARAYLSSRSYGGKAYCGAKLVHSLLTLGSPHGNSEGPAFRGVKWVNREGAPPSVRCMAVGAKGSLGRDSHPLTRSSYSLCGASDGGEVDGDGVTPLSSQLAFPGAEHLVLDGATHFPWGKVFGGDDWKPWYGSEEMVDQWAPWLLQGKARV